MAMLEQRFSARVGAYLGRTGLRPTTFGLKPVDAPNLIRQKGRWSPLRVAATRCRAFPTSNGHQPNPATARIR